MLKHRFGETKFKDNKNGENNEYKPLPCIKESTSHKQDPTVADVSKNNKNVNEQDKDRSQNNYSENDQRKITANKPKAKKVREHLKEVSQLQAVNVKCKLNIMQDKTFCIEDNETVTRSKSLPNKNQNNYSKRCRCNSK